MTAILILSAGLIAGGLGLALQTLLSQRLVGLDRRATSRLLAAEHTELPERGHWLAALGARLLPFTPAGYVRALRADLYWLRFREDPQWGARSADEILARQLLLALVLALALDTVLDSALGLALGALLGWRLAVSSLHGRGARLRRQVEAELPEVLHLMAAQAAGGASLEAILRRIARGPSLVSDWLAGVLRASQGRELVGTSPQTAGQLYAAALESGHPALITLAIQLSFVQRGVQAPELLGSLAGQFADSYLGAAEVRAEQLANTLGMYTALFYFFPFLFVILTVISLPIARSLAGY
jgi:Flp pilus assembly protein TadB